MYRSQSVGDVLQQRMCIEYKWMDIQQSWSAYHGRYRKICWFRALFCAYRITCGIEIKNSAAILALVPALAHLAHARQHTHTYTCSHSRPFAANAIHKCLSLSIVHCRYSIIQQCFIYCIRLVARYYTYLSMCVCVFDCRLRLLHRRHTSRTHTIANQALEQSRFHFRPAPYFYSYMLDSQYTHIIRSRQNAQPHSSCIIIYIET